MDTTQRRKLGGAGLVFIAAFLVSSFVVTNVHNYPTEAQALSFARSNRVGLGIEAYAVIIAVVVGVTFYWYLRELVAAAPGMRSLATLGFAGALLFAASGAISAGIDWAMQDQAHHASGAAMQALSAVGFDVVSLTSSCGIAILLGATGLAIVRSRVLPSWTGWVGIVLAVVSVALPFLGGTTGALWTLLVSITLLTSRTTTITLGTGERRDPLPVS